ncbi:MAG: J domain-containing protein [Thermodesulfobacteriota bacterium]
MTESSESPYEILGLESSATDREIKRRYRRLSRRFHPDLNPDDPQAEENFKRVQWAYRCLTVGQTSKTVHEPPTGHRGDADAFIDDVHPFHGFFAALRAYSMTMREKKNKGEDEAK